MGYTTRFTGELLFTVDLNGKQLAKVKSFFGEDCRDHPEWDAEGTYIDLKLNENFTGIEWDDGTEKNNGMVSHVNLIINEMKKMMPKFGLKGNLKAQGEDPEDRWIMNIVGGVAVEERVSVNGRTVTCPHCDEEFIIDAED